MLISAAFVVVGKKFELLESIIRACPSDLRPRRKEYG